MTKPRVSAVVTLLACASAHAGTFVEASRTDLTNLLRSPQTQKLWFDAGQLRIEGEDPGEPVEIFKAHTLFVSQPAHGQLARPAAAGPDRALVAQQTTREESVAGQRCRIWEILAVAARLQELCVIPAASLPGGEDMLATMRAVGAALRAADAPPAAHKTVAEAWIGLPQVDGIPVLARFFQGTRAVTEIRLTGVRAEPIPFTAFDLPAEYNTHAAAAHRALAASTTGDHSGAVRARHSRT